MQDSIVSFPAIQETKHTVINQKITEISPEMRSKSISISPIVQKYVQYPRFLSPLTYGDVMSSSSQKMDAVYENVMSFLKKVHEEDAVL